MRYIAYSDVALHVRRKFKKVDVVNPSRFPH
jgi:hypothetical protein